MLIQHHDVAEGRGAPPWRAVFLRHLQEVGGFPKKLRKISVINGSASGLAQTGMSPGQNYLEIIAKYGVARGIFNVYAAPAGLSVAGLTAHAKTIIFGVPKEYKRHAVGTIDGFSPDQIAGGHHDSLSELVKAMLKELPDSREIALYQPIHSFIPSTSAAALNNGRSSFNFAGMDLVAAGLTPFDKIYAPAENQKHVQLSLEAAGWFKTEILDYPRFSEPFMGRFAPGQTVYGNALSFTASSYPGASSFVWTVGADAYINNAFVKAGTPKLVEGGPANIVIPCQDANCYTGSYPVKVYAPRGNVYGRSAENAFSLTVFGTPPPGNGPGYEQARASVAPNPAKGEVWVHFGNGPDFEKDYDLVLFSPYGQAVRQLKSKKKKVKIDAAGLPVGIYYLHHLTSSGTDKIRVVLEN